MRMHLSKRLLPLLALVAIMIVALWFRLKGLTTAPFWLDEAYSAYAADKGLHFILTVLPGYETHPPFYSALLSGWTLFAGNSIGGFRSLGVVAGLLLFPLVWTTVSCAAQQMGSPAQRAAFAALALLAITPAIIYITRLVRPYALMTLAYLIGIWALLALAGHHRTTAALRSRYWYIYLASLALTVWLHNLGSLYAASLGLALIILIGPQTLWKDHARQFLAGHIIVALIVLPALLILLDQAPTWQQSTWLRFRWDSVGVNLLTIYGFSGLFAVALATLLIGIAAVQTRQYWRLWLALLILGCLPMLLSLLLSITVAPVFLARTLAPLSIVIIIMLGLAVARPSLISSAAFGALLLLTGAYSVAASRLPPTENWYGAVTWLHARLAPGDIVYAYPNEAALPFHYALRDKGIDVPVRPIPGPVPAQDPTGWYPTGSRGVVSLPPYRLAAIAADPQSQRRRTIWLLRMGASTYDKGDGFLKALSRDRTVVARWRDVPIDIIGLRQSERRSPPKQSQP